MTIQTKTAKPITADENPSGEDHIARHKRRCLIPLASSPIPGEVQAAETALGHHSLILAYSGPGDIVLDPFTTGSGTTAFAAKLLGRRYIGIELDKRYAQLSRERIDKCDVGETR